MITFSNINFKYKNNKTDKGNLIDINLTIEEGELIVLTGESGCGKTTFTRLINGLAPNYYPGTVTGELLFDGENITNMSITDRAKKGISFAFQQPVRFKGLTVRDLITLAAGRQISVGEACNYLSEVGLCARDYINREVNASLSGGELKRIEIATVLARGTRFTVFDEPEAGIDLWSFGNLINVFEKMHEKQKGTILIISHQERILNIADKIVVIAGGRLEKIGTKEEILPELLGAAGGTCRTLLDKIS